MWRRGVLFEGPEGYLAAAWGVEGRRHVGQRGGRALQVCLTRNGGAVGVAAWEGACQPRVQLGASFGACECWGEPDGAAQVQAAQGHVATLPSL